MSSSTKFGCQSRATTVASAPFDASATEKPAVSSNFLAIARNPSWSSTTSTEGGRWTSSEPRALEQLRPVPPAHFAPLFTRAA
jgi:hypothetical protein